MKLGFYLSPDGNHIIEIKQSESTHFVDIIGFDGEFEDFLFDLSKCCLYIIFSSWELLE
jgi:hypothetical protein